MNQARVIKVSRKRFIWYDGYHATSKHGPAGINLPGRVCYGKEVVLVLIDADDALPVERVDDADQVGRTGGANDRAAIMEPPSLKGLC